MVKVLPLVSSLAGAGAMLFKPNNPKNVMWDTWLFVEKNHGTSPFYLNYLSNCDASCGGPTGGMWNGVGAAVSMDGVHFADEGIVIHKDPGAVWLGSGSVLKTADGEYVMNFSEEYDCEGSNCQSIFFATSKDLRTWQRLPFKPPPANDPNVFKYGDGYKVGGRWDCIATVPKPNEPGHFYGYWTATPNAGVGAGVGETTDTTGHHWRALPPITEGFPHGEVGSTIVHKGRYFMLFGGGHLYTSNDPIAGYQADALNHAFHTDGDGVAFSRLWNLQDDNETVLLTHQIKVSHDEVWMAPIKQAVLGSDDTLRVMYWKGNEKLKGDPISLSAPRVSKSCVQMFDTELPMANGVVVEAPIQCSKGVRAGVVLGDANSTGTAFIWDCSTQIFEIGTMAHGAFRTAASWNRTTSFTGSTLNLRLLARRPGFASGTHLMTEFYINDVLSHPYMTSVSPSALYLGVVNLADGHVSQPVAMQTLSAWRMTLPADGTNSVAFV